ncbi:unnamed protein product [Knipowitschia caucasica]|uniref:L1 transposable element RRM domain-containing protein n=1 Tax=Knipowitschia caucasica TaxID=637954 RepID=A0AAV2J193_KNICA
MPQTRSRRKKQQGSKLEMSAKDVSKSTTAAADEDTPGWAKCLIATFNKNQLDLNAKLEEINTSVHSISKEFKEMNDRVTAAEKRISDLEDSRNEENCTVQTLLKQVSTLAVRVDMLEARSRMNNIRIIGLKEGMEVDNLMGLLDQLFRYILDVEESDTTPEVERAHRALRPRPNPEDPPRMVIVRLLRWRDKLKLLMAAKKKGSLSWDGQPFYIRQDLTSEVRRQRAEYNEIIEELKKQGVRVGVLYPARLVATIDRKKCIFETPEEARRGLSRLLQKTRASVPDSAT